MKNNKYTFKCYDKELFEIEFYETLVIENEITVIVYSSDEDLALAKVKNKIKREYYELIKIEEII